MRNTKRKGISGAAAMPMREQIAKHETKHDTHAFGYRDKLPTSVNADTWRASRGYAGSFQTPSERSWI